MYKELLELNQSSEYPLHMPGHKRQTGFGQIDEALKIDITEIKGYDDLYEPEGIIKSALDRASRLYKSDKTFFLVNGSTVGILTAVFAVTEYGDNVLMARNCHKSVYHAAELNHLNSDYLVPIQKKGIFDSVNSEEIEMQLQQKSYKAVIITSPTYEGKVSDISAIADICHKYNTILVVDEAHGAHLGFHDRFPKSAITLGADIVIQSTHKTLPTMTQTGLLHIRSKLIEIERIEKYLQMFQTSSPSYVLMSSIDSCLEEIECVGSSLWNNFFEYRDKFCAEVACMENLSLVESDDACKVVISTEGTDINGPQLADVLLSKYKLQLEMVSANYVVAIMTCNDTAEGFERFAKALIEIDSSLNKLEENDVDETGEDFEQIIAEDYIYIYPPGIPLAVPGEVITKEALKTINEYKKAGLTVRGFK